MKLLGLDTSGEACSAALLADNVISQRLERAPRRHGELILPMAESLLAERGLRLSDLDAIAFSRGPGSFTGVRIAVAVAQGIAFGAGLDTVPVSTLAALAQGEHRRSGRRRILAALDARMGEVYWGCFELGPDGVMVPLGQELVCPPDRVPTPLGPGWWGVGPGWAVYTQVLRDRVGPGLDGSSGDAICEAQDLVRIAGTALLAGDRVSPELARPVYLRDQVTDRG
ncbi:MAG: tRNA (adenosine(37)-N6)-threonylcarbamoyltransferase complex dimerization subunit type 1 TsaB [Bdellovibrio bacteriovorus]